MTLFQSERPTLPMWGKPEKRPDKKEEKEREPVWQEVSVGQVEGESEHHTKFGWGLQDSYRVIEGFAGNKDWLWAGCYDGHYKPWQAHDKQKPQNIVEEFLHSNFLEEIDRGRPIAEAFEKAFQKTSDKIKKNSVGGSTATVALIAGKEAWLANVGDSHAYRFKRGGKVDLLSADHNITTNSKAEEEAKNRGGILSKGGAYIEKHDKNGNPIAGLKMSRTLGDEGMGEVVSAQPDIRHLEISEDDEYLVLASDGLWEDVSLADAKDVVNASSGALEVQQNLIEAVREARGKPIDDVTIIAIKLKK